MKLTAQETYGLRCLLQVAKRGYRGSITIPEISLAEGLSVPNAAKMMRLLRLGGLVTSIRGQSGGFTLTAPAHKIKVAEVLDVLGGPLYSPEFCAHHSGDEQVCRHSSDCPLRPVWRALQAAITGVLKQITLRDLLCDENEMTLFVDHYLPRPASLHWIGESSPYLGKEHNS